MITRGPRKRSRRRRRRHAADRSDRITAVRVFSNARKRFGPGGILEEHGDGRTGIGKI